MNNQWLTIEQVGNDVVLRKCSREAEGVIEIPENITHIADGAFDESNVTIKNLPEGLKAFTEFTAKFTLLENPSRKFMTFMRCA